MCYRGGKEGTRETPTCHDSGWDTSKAPEIKREVKTDAGFTTYPSCVDMLMAALHSGKLCRSARRPAKYDSRCKKSGWPLAAEDR